MDRKIIPHLQQWLHKKQRQPLVIRGARQVGKTWLVRHLAQLEKRELIELNFEREPAFKTFFNTNDPKKILQNIRHYFNKEIPVERTILFLDEIQEAPELFATLRWFAEELPALPVIAAGSLLEFVLEAPSFSMPVGRINYMHLEPFSFEEYLLAIRQEGLVDFLQTYSLKHSPTIPSLLHEQLMQYVREYTFVGGLPATIKTWVETQTFSDVNEVQSHLLNTYRDDFAKYRGRLTLERLEDIWYAAPKMLGKAWKYSQINPHVSSTSLKQALHLLTLAKICHPIYSCTADGAPLAAGLHKRVFKVLFLDIGLVSSALGLLLQRNLHQFSLINEGGLAEQFVGQALRTSFPFYQEPALYYWHRDKKGSSAEIDYLLQHETDIIPVEVKAGKTGTLRSLHALMALRQWQTALRFNSDDPNVTPINVTTPQGNDHSYQLLSLPFYLVGQWQRLVDEMKTL